MKRREKALSKSADKFFENEIGVSMAGKTKCRYSRHKNAWPQSTRLFTNRRALSTKSSILHVGSYRVVTLKARKPNKKWVPCKSLAIWSICYFEVLAENETIHAARYFEAYGPLARQSKARSMAIWSQHQTIPQCLNYVLDCLKEYPKFFQLAYSLDLSFRSLPCPENDNWCTNICHCRFTSRTHRQRNFVWKCEW